MVHVAFICHCDKKHGKVIFKDDDITVDFIDPWSGCKGWRDIESNSIDVFYTISCPIYYPFFEKEFDKYKYPKTYRELLEERNEDKRAILEEMKKEGSDKDQKEIMDSIFIDGFDRLKKKGKLVFPIYYMNRNQHYKNFIDYIKEMYPQVEFSYTVSKTVPYEYTLHWGEWGLLAERENLEEDYTFNNPNTRFLILTKEDSRDKFYEELELLGKDRFLKRFLTKEQFIDRRVSTIEMNFVIEKIKRVYRMATNKDILKLFTKEEQAKRFVR